MILGEGEGRLYLTLHCHHQNDSCIKMGSDERHFNVSLFLSGKVTVTVSINHRKPKRNQTEILRMPACPRACVCLHSFTLPQFLIV